MTSPAESAIWAATLDIYRGFLAGDRRRVDGHLDPEVTLWDSEEAELIRGLTALNAARDRRPTESSPVLALEATDPLIDVWGDTALVRHWLTVRFADSDTVPQSVRVSSVWRLTDGRWLAVHNHEDVRAEPRDGRPQ